MIEHKSGRAVVAVDIDVAWLPIESAPTGAKLQLLTVGGIALYGRISERTRKDYAGWQRLPSMTAEIRAAQRRGILGGD